MRSLGGLFVLSLLMCSCDVDYAWDMKGAPTTPPDEQYRTGTEDGTDLWIWHCYKDERIAITQYATAMWGAKKPQMEKGKCGPLLPSEIANASRHPHAIQDGMRWPGSPPPTVTDASAEASPHE